MKNLHFLVLISIMSLMSYCNPPKEIIKVERWDVFEIALTGPTDGNPYIENQLSATFVNNSHQVSVPGFYDGNGTYRVRFSPDVLGEWSYITESNVEELTKQKGLFECVAPKTNNHGPVKVTNTYYLQYADSTPYYAIGTTAYQWTSVKQSIQEQTLSTLEKSPFNKIRMCVFPKTYIYGNETEPWVYPFKREGDMNDFSQPNYEFFQNFDKRVEQLLDLGIQSDVILFHPYDKWGYSEMGNELNFRYVRYMIARLSAYRNVWWSLANEWDIPEIKETIDWEKIGTILQQEDPHQRMRGIHNWYDSDDHFFDHSRPWITHTSTQTAQFYNAIKWREQYKKPLLLDEMRYEGDVPSGWGNLSGEEMTSYFWMAALSGGYPTHGETLQNNSDSTEVRWWAKGGTLMGESPKRIAFFKTVMEDVPVKEMQPELIPNGTPENLKNNIYIFSDPGKYYMAYVADEKIMIQINLAGEMEYKVDVIDTWNMSVTEQLVARPGEFSYQTTVPYTALKIQPKYD